MLNGPFEKESTLKLLKLAITTACVNSFPQLLHSFPALRAPFEANFHCNVRKCTTATFIGTNS